MYTLCARVDPEVVTVEPLWAGSSVRGSSLSVCCYSRACRAFYRGDLVSCLENFRGRSDAAGLCRFLRST